MMKIVCYRTLFAVLLVASFALAQRTDVSQGRSPSGSDTLVSFAQPTPGGPNPFPNGGVSSVTNIAAQIVTLITPTNFWRWDNSGGTNLATSGVNAWFTNSFSDAAWSNGLPLFGYGAAIPSHYIWEKNKPALSYGLMPFVWAIGCDSRQAFGFYTGRLTRDVNEVRAALNLTPAQITLADAPELSTAA